MTTKTCFDFHGLKGTNTCEQDLINNLVAEAIQMFGFDVKYLPRTLIKEDKLFGEDVLSMFDTAYTIEIYMENVDGFEGEAEFMKKFGLSVGDQATLIVSRPRFTEITTMPKPLEGDLIHFPFNDSLFEIKFVEDEQQFYPAGTLPQYKLTIETFVYSSERFTTGDTEIDDVSDIDQVLGTDPSSKNDDIETEADSILDFTETNPFGDY